MSIHKRIIDKMHRFIQKNGISPQKGILGRNQFYDLCKQTPAMFIMIPETPPFSSSRRHIEYCGIRFTISRHSNYLRIY